MSYKQTLNITEEISKDHDVEVGFWEGDLTDTATGWLVYIKCKCNPSVSVVMYVFSHFRRYQHLLTPHPILAGYLTHLI